MFWKMLVVKMKMIVITEIWAFQSLTPQDHYDDGFFLSLHFDLT